MLFKSAFGSCFVVFFCAFLFLEVGMVSVSFVKINTIDSLLVWILICYLFMFWPSTGMRSEGTSESI